MSHTSGYLCRYCLRSALAGQRHAYSTHSPASQRSVCSVVFNHFIVEPLHDRDMKKRVASALHKLKIHGMRIDCRTDSDEGVDNIDAIREAWSAIDATSEGQVSSHSFDIFFRTLLKQLGTTDLSHVKNVTAHALQTIDEDQDGFIAFSEFLDYIRSGELRKFVRMNSSKSIRQDSLELEVDDNRADTGVHGMFAAAADDAVQFGGLGEALQDVIPPATKALRLPGGGGGL